jgi:hypothetical protein
MSVASFQQALCDLIASPRLCLALRNTPENVLEDYDLTARERTRLMDIVWQRGMSTNCTLYRSNRVTPIYTLLNFTCRSLGDQLGPLLDQFWDAKEYQDGQFYSETERFAAFLRQRIADHVVSSPFAAELLEFELALNELEFRPHKDGQRKVADLPLPESETPCQLHPLARIVHFRHDPATVLEAASSGTMPSDLPERHASIVLSVVNGAPTVTQLPHDAYRVLVDEAQSGEPLTPRRLPALADLGLLVPALRS